MGCCVGSQKVEINERNYSPGSSSKELSESPQEQITEEHSNNKDVDSGYGKTKVAYMILCKKNTHIKCIRLGFIHILVFNKFDINVCSKTYIQLF